MTQPEAAATNAASDSAYVGVQAGTVHGGIHYSIPPGASPREKFEVGAKYLDGGAPEQARRLIGAAVDARHVGNKVCFYWQLALVSGRTRDEMSAEDAAVLRSAPHMCQVSGDDAWADGVNLIRRLLEAAQEPHADLRPLLKDLDALGHTQHTMMLRHLELYLEGPLKDQIWHRALEEAKAEQMTGGRVDRVWKFFHPDPAGPRERPAHPPMIPLATWIQAVLASAVIGATTIHLGYLLMQAHRTLAFFACLLSIGSGGYLTARNGTEWRFRTVRRRAKDEEFRSHRRRSTGAPDGFAKKVDQHFDHYFARYVPRGTERSIWLASTQGIRQTIRDEIVEVYREQRIGVEKIAWLIRHRVSDVRSRWENGTLWSYRQELETPLRTKAMTLLGVIALVGGGIRAVEAAVQARPLSASRSTAFGLMASFIAAHAWLYIVLERRRHTADESENKRTLDGCRAAFDRWKEKLADRPRDDEMATWLNYDRKVLLAEVLRHYKLSMSNVIAHTFIEAPATASTRRARVKNGPWRYRQYRILVFLLTTEGVRQIDVKLDFTQGRFHDRHRMNYRYEAVAAVRVRQADDDERRFELTLVNGQEVSVEGMDPGKEEHLDDENPQTVSEVTLEATGLHHTLHVLEGIAAEGGAWFTRERRRGAA